MASGYFQGLARKPSAKRAEARLAKAAAVEARGPKSPKSVRFRLTDIERVAAEMWENIKKRSVRNGLELGLDRESLNTMVHEFCRLNHFSLIGKDPFKPSPDRIDNSKGYTKENTRIVWMMENYARSTFSDEQVIEFCKRKLGLL